MRKKSKKAFILAVLIAISALLGGCSDSKGSAAPGEDTQAAETPIATAAPEITPTPTAEPTPTPTPTPEPTATPEPTPFIRTSYEIPSEGYIKTELKKLGIIPDAEYYRANEFKCLFFEKDGQLISYPVKMPKTEKNKKSYVVSDAFTDEELFSFETSNCKINYSASDSDGYIFKNFTKISPKIDYFEDVEPSSIKINIMWYWWMIDISLSYMDKDEYLDFIHKLYEGKHTYNNSEHFHTREEIGWYYIAGCPPEYRINKYDLHPELND